MSFKPRFSIITASLGDLGDRFLTSGYKEDFSLEEKLKRVSEIEDLDGVELCYDPEGEESDASEVKSLLDKYKVAAPVVNAPLSSAKKWKYGTLSAADGEIRKNAIQEGKDTIDFAKKTGSEIVNIWMGQDGFDYSFQVDHSEQWDRMVESVRELADYNRDIKIALEFKPREPRNRALLNTASTTLLMIRDIDRENVGVTVDNGHILQHDENMAHVIELCARYGKLFNLHLNDNYAGWDDDMIVGSVHLTEYLELLYSLHKINYSGWAAIDIFPFREDSFRATEESVRYLQVYNNWINKVGFDKIGKMIGDTNVTEVMKMIRETLF